MPYDPTKPLQSWRLLEDLSLRERVCWVRQLKVDDEKVGACFFFGRPAALALPVDFACRIGARQIGVLLRNLTTVSYKVTVKLEASDAQGNLDLMQSHTPPANLASLEDDLDPGVPTVTDFAWNDARAFVGWVVDFARPVVLPLRIKAQLKAVTKVEEIYGTLARPDQVGDLIIRIQG